MWALASITVIIEFAFGAKILAQIILPMDPLGSISPKAGLGSGEISPVLNVGPNN